MTPYHSVPSRTMRATPTDTVLVSPKNWSNPDMVASAIPRPPGIMLTAPTRDEKLKTKVVTVRVKYWLKPSTTM